MVSIIGHSRKGKTMNTTKRSLVVREKREGGWTVRAHIFLGQWNVLYDIMMSIYHYACVQIHRMNNTKSKPWGMLQSLMCQRRSILVKKKCAFLENDVNMVEAVHMWRQEVYEKSLHHPFNGVVNLKLLKNCL